MTSPKGINVMTKSIWVRLWAGAGLAILLTTGCASLLRPPLNDVDVSPAVISPNADGVEDATRIQYTLGRNADVSIFFTDQNGEVFHFRDNRPRSPGDYEVLWGGVVNQPRSVDDGTGARQVASEWVLPDGPYTWAIEARDEQGNTSTVTGTITLQDGDTTLPLMNNFTVVPQEFRPNQDGLRDLLVRTDRTD